MIFVEPLLLGNLPHLEAGLAEVAKRCHAPGYDIAVLGRLTKGDVKTLIVKEDSVTIGWLIYEHATPGGLFIHAAWVIPRHRSPARIKRAIHDLKIFLHSIGVTSVAFVSPRSWTWLGFSASATLWTAEC